ncbi:unnamed protein product [Amaranthus hypochondriacus]
MLLSCAGILGFILPSMSPSKTRTFLFSFSSPNFIHVSSSCIFLQSCFTYSIVSPKIEALSILVTKGTNDLKMMNLSFNFSLLLRSANIWLADRSSWTEPFF